MNELEQLRSLWRPKPRRSRELIVQSISSDASSGCIEVPSWAFQISYGFRNALDIRFSPLKENRRTVYRWTQGPFLTFECGDILHSKDGMTTLSVTSAASMAWDAEANSMKLGEVNFQLISHTEGGSNIECSLSLDQMSFLAVLISGNVRGT